MYINCDLANRVTGAIGSVASGIVGNKEAQSKLLFELTIPLLYCY